MILHNIKLEYIVVFVVVKLALQFVIDVVSLQCLIAFYRT